MPNYALSTALKERCGIVLEAMSDFKIGQYYFSVVLSILI